MAMKNKKGFFFTIAVLAIISLFFVTYSFYNEYQDRKSINTRITTMNNYILSLEKDLSRQLYIAGFRTIFILEKNIVESGNYIQNLNSSFQESFFNGTINNIQQNLMQGATFFDIQEKIKYDASKININLSLSNPSLKITQDNPWNVKLILNAHLEAKDENNLASWNKEETIISYIPIENFEDPIYFINTNGLITNKISRSPYSNFTIQNLLSQVQNGYYLNSISAPSFLDRLEGKIYSTSPYGIESLVNLPELSKQGIAIQDKSAVDYIYFSSSSPSSCSISGMPSWFKLDSPHLSIYGVSCS